jgi:hypothetical protein
VAFELELGIWLHFKEASQLRGEILEQVFSVLDPGWGILNFENFLWSI